MQLCLALFCFLARTYNVPQADYAAVKAALHNTRLNRTRLSLEELHEIFYRDFELAFCTRDSHRPTPNVHTFYHLWEVRERTGLPLWATSAEIFEAFYAILRLCFTSGTRNVPRQLFDNGNMRMK